MNTITPYKEYMPIAKQNIQFRRKAQSVVKTRTTPEYKKWELIFKMRKYSNARIPPPTALPERGRSMSTYSATQHGREIMGNTFCVVNNNMQTIKHSIAIRQPKASSCHRIKFEKLLKMYNTLPKSHTIDHYRRVRVQSVQYNRNVNLIYKRNELGHGRNIKSKSILFRSREEMKKLKIANWDASYNQCLLNGTIVV